jgi:hypothetical protein
VKRPINDDEVLQALKERLSERGEAARLAKQLGRTPTLLAVYKGGHRPISEHVAAALGYERVSVWRKKC